MIRIEVRADRAYEVAVGSGALAGVGDAVGDAQRVAVLHPRTLRPVAERLADAVAADVSLVEVPDAEQAKTAAVLDGCWRLLADEGFTRSDVVVGLGGGATTDLAGFVAATWLRGVRYVAVPTTVLGMVDAAVGGKTGINLPQGKNLVGAFHEPAAVLCDLDLLATLPDADLRAGLAEVVKCGFIADPAILDLVEADPAAVTDPASPALAEAVVRGIRVKADVVSADLRESTSVGKRVGRELLNYGHTLGHAIERREGYTWRHGEAISVGMVFVAELSHALGRLDAATLARHRDVLASLGLPTTYDADAWADLRAAMNLDKKTRGSSLRFVVLDALVDAAVLSSPPEDALAAAWARIAEER